MARYVCIVYHRHCAEVLYVHSTLLHSAVDTVTNKCCLDRFVGAPAGGRVRRLRRDPVRGDCGGIHCLSFLVNYLYIYALVSRNYDGFF